MTQLLPVEEEHLLAFELELSDEVPPVCTRMVHEQKICGVVAAYQLLCPCGSSHPEYLCAGHAKRDGRYLGTWLGKIVETEIWFSGCGHKVPMTEVVLLPL